jgi:serine/threonine-protein kinase
VVAFQRRDLPAAIRDARRALVYSPMLADAHELIGRILTETGPADKALVHLQTAAETEPELRGARARMLRVHELLGRRAEADLVAEEIIARHDGGPGWTVLARAVFWRRDEARARSLFEHAVIQSGGAPAARELFRAVFEPATTPSAGKLVAASLSAVGASWRMPVFLEQARAEFFAAKGRVEDALAALTSSVDAGLVDLLWLDRCPVLDGVRGDARFAPLRARVGGKAESVHAALADPDLT